MAKKESIPQKPLTREQVRHAKLRIEQIAGRKVSALGKLNKWKGDAALDLLEQELRAGRFTVPSKGEMREKPVRADLHRVLKFDRFPRGFDDAEKEVEAGNAGIEAKRDAIYAEAARIIDELILGDAHEALAAIRAFEAKSF